MTALQPYLISEFKTGINNYLEPWVRLQDAFDPLFNAYIYRGTINKRCGIETFGNRLADHNPVMGIIQRIDETNGNIQLVACSTTNAYLYDVAGNVFNALTSVKNSIFWYGTIPGGLTVTVPTFWPNLAHNTVSISDGTSTITDDGAGNLSASGNFAAGGTVNYTTGVVKLNFVAALTVSLTLQATSTNYFTGNNTNFFNWVNWQPTDPTTLVESTSYLYLTNSVDPVTLFDGTFLSRPILYTSTTHNNWIVAAQDVQVYKNCLLLFKPQLNTETNPLNQGIAYSAPFNPTNFATEPGNGGMIVVATGDIFIAEDILRDAIIMFFSNSTWIFRFTGLVSDPFHVDRISINKRSNAPYGSVTYDERVTSVGSTGFLACDGVNVQRYDISIIEYFEKEISEAFYGQCFSQRYDNLNQTWMLYVSNSNGTTPIGGGAKGSDRALVYNHLENTWATFTWPILTTCLGIYFLQAGVAWQNVTQTWEQLDIPWNSFGNQKAAPILLMGDVSGNIYRVDDQKQLTDSGTPVTVDILGARWNPIVQTGQKIQFTYLDVYYQVVSTDSTNPITLTLNFYVDNSDNYAAQRTLTMDGPADTGYTWKRIYCNLIGEFVQLEIIGGAGANWQILGLNLWMKPAGRFTPP